MEWRCGFSVSPMQESWTFSSYLFSENSQPQRDRIHWGCGSKHWWQMFLRYQQFPCSGCFKDDHLPKFIFFGSLLQVLSYVVDTKKNPSKKYWRQLWKTLILTVPTGKLSLRTKNIWWNMGLKCWNKKTWRYTKEERNDQWNPPNVAICLGLMLGYLATWMSRTMSHCSTLICFLNAESNGNCPLWGKKMHTHS